MLQPLCRYQRSDTEKLELDPLPIFNPEKALLKLSLTSCIPKLIPADKKSEVLGIVTLPSIGNTTPLSKFWHCKSRLISPLVGSKFARLGTMEPPKLNWFHDISKFPIAPLK